MVNEEGKCGRGKHGKTEMPLCKPHFVDVIRSILKKEFKSIYRYSDPAFIAMDMAGEGVASASNFCQNLACTRAVANYNLLKASSKIPKLKLSDIFEFTACSGLFKGGYITHALFKRNFFPQLCHAEEKVARSPSQAS